MNHDVAIMAIYVVTTWALALIARRISTMSEALGRLTQEVSDLTAVDESVLILIDGLATQIRDAASINDTDALNALADKLDAEKSKLAAAVTANTPATGEAPVEPAPEQPAE
jgi:hypothetical protein